MKTHLKAIAIPLFSFCISFFFNSDQKTLLRNNEYNDLALDGNPKDRASWELTRLADPATGKIPFGIFEKEIAFASTIPSDEKYRGGLSWIHRGPYHTGGRTRGLGIDIRNENIILAGGVSGGIWRSTDQGATWKKMTQPDQLHNVSCLVQDQRQGKEDIWYYGTGEAYGNSASAPGAFFYGNGMYKSADNGLTWNSLPSTASNTPNEFNSWDIIWKIIADVSNDTQDVVYAATLGVIHKSVNGGTTWNDVLGSSTSSYFSDIAITKTGVVYATLSSGSSSKGIYRSTDGVSWTKILPDSFPSTYDRIVIGIDPNNENKVWFLAHTPGFGKKSLNYRGEEDWNSLWKYEYLSGNGSGNGGYWQNLSKNIPSKEDKSFDNFNAQGSYNLVVSVMPGDSNTVFIAGTNIYRSTDAFKTANHIVQTGGYQPGTKRPNWSVYPTHHPDQHALLFMKTKPLAMINANDGGVFITENCLADTVKWNIMNNGYVTTQLYTVSFVPDKNDNRIVIGLQDNGNLFTTSHDPLTDWTLPLNGDGSYSAIAPGGEFYVLSTQLGRMVKMTIDANGNKDKFARIDPIGASKYLFINPFAMDPNNKGIIYMAEGSKLWRNDSIDKIPFNSNYDSIRTGWFRFTDTVEYPNRSISAIAVTTKNPANRVYFGTSGNLIYRIDNANTGDPANQKIYKPGTMVGNVSCIAVNPENGDQLIAVYSNYNVYSLFYSSDGGINWSKIGGNLEQFSDGTGSGPSCRWASILPIGGKMLYFVGTSVGLFATDTLMGEATQWVKIGASIIGNVVVEMVKTRPLDGLLVVATHGNGLYSARIKNPEDVMGILDYARKPDIGLKLFPNPVNEYFTLHFNLPYSRPVKINLVSVATGQIYLVSGTKTMDFGEHRIEVNSANLPPGNYICRIQVGSLVYSIKMLKVCK